MYLESVAFTDNAVAFWTMTTDNFVDFYFSLTFICFDVETTATKVISKFIKKITQDCFYSIFFVSIY